MLRFKNGKVLDMNGPAEIEEKEVWVQDGKIIFVGLPSDQLIKSTEFEKEYDLEGNLIMPSFKNAHTHSAMTFLRSYADDLPLQDWLFKQVFPMEAKLTVRMFTGLQSLLFWNILHPNNRFLRYVL